MCGDSYLSDTEYILFFRQSGAYFGGSVKTKKKFYISPLNTVDKKLYQHPTCKPVELLKKYIINSSKEDDIVLDCFAGSGSLAQACLETNRNFLCCERDEKYVKVANDRLANWKQDLERQDKWLNERGVENFESDIKDEAKQQNNQGSLF
jgi:DNA modification methylase